MKTMTIIGGLFVAVLSTMHAEDDPFAKTAEEPARPDRKILKLPKAVTHSLIAASKHEYTVSGIYSGAAKNKAVENVASVYKSCIPNALDVALDFKASKATFSTSRELSYSELAYAIDDMAELGGDIPFWFELEARDIEITTEYNRSRYTIQATTKDAPSELAWFWVPEDRVFTIPLNVGAPELGSLLIVPSTAFCMCHSSFTLRILDPEGKLIWKDEASAYAGVKIALSNAKDSAMHRIWMNREDHGKSKQFLISGHMVKEQETEKTKPSAGDKPSK